MNSSNFAHAGLALACQFLTALIAWAVGAEFFEACVMGGMLAVGFYLGREVTQAERKAGGDPWYIGFEMRLWSTDAIYDLLFPTIACSVVCALSAFWG